MKNKNNLLISSKFVQSKTMSSKSVQKLKKEDKIFDSFYVVGFKDYDCTFSFFLKLNS
jgi:hypothetical protein